MLEPVLYGPLECFKYRLMRAIGRRNKVELVELAAKRRSIFGSQQEMVDSYLGRGLGSCSRNLRPYEQIQGDPPASRPRSRRQAQASGKPAGRRHGSAYHRRRSAGAGRAGGVANTRARPACGGAVRVSGLRGRCEAAQSASARRLSPIASLRLALPPLRRGSLESPHARNDRSSGFKSGCLDICGWYCQVCMT